MRLTNQKAFWKDKWKGLPTPPPNRFARRCLAAIKPLGYRTLLELGCGNGRDTLLFAKSGLRVTALDCSESGIESLQKQAAERHLDIRTLCTSMESLPFKDNSFNVIYAHLSLHYFNDPATDALFISLHRILRKGGRLFVKCKSTDDALCGKGQKLGDDIYLEGHIRHFFSKDYMTEKLRSFRILRVRRTSSTYHLYKSSFIEAVATK